MMSILGSDVRNPLVILFVLFTVSRLFHMYIDPGCFPLISRMQRVSILYSIKITRQYFFSFCDCSLHMVLLSFLHFFKKNTGLMKGTILFMLLVSDVLLHLFYFF